MDYHIAFSLGETAFCDGKNPKTDNPYLPGTIERAAWLDGYFGVGPFNETIIKGDENHAAKSF
jgi:hypothetical protein